MPTIIEEPNATDLSQDRQSALAHPLARSILRLGVVLVIAEAVYSATDPPLRFLRRYIPSLRLGTVGLDLSFMLLFLVVLVLWQVVQIR